MSNKSEKEKLHGWGPLLNLLEDRQQIARAMGGTAKLEKRRADGALNARERIDLLLGFSGPVIG